MTDSLLNAEKPLREFHEKYGHYISETPSLDVPENVVILRHKLVAEEVGETFDAMGTIDLGSISGEPNIIYDSAERSLVEIADGIADSIYVLVGTAVSYGIPIDRVFREVHRSNMTKTAIKAEDGQKYGTKTPKGPDYIPPDIEGILSRPNELTRLETMYVEDSIGIDISISVK